MHGILYYAMLGALLLFLLSFFVTVSQGVLNIAFWILVLALIGKIVELLF